MRFLKDGVTGLARAGETTWFDGHYGAALIATHFLPATPEVAAYAESWAAVNPKMFVPFPDEPPAPDAEARLLAALAPNLAPLRRSGHGVIFASLALRAWHAAPAIFTPSIVAGLERLLRDTREDKPTRYYGTANYFDYEPRTPRYQSTEDMILRTLESMREIYPDGEYDGAYHYLSSEKLHTIDYAAALVDIEAMGYGALARDGWESHHCHLELTLPHPPGLAPKTDRDAGMMPWKPRYWKRDHLDDHALKLAYGGMRLIDRLHETLYARLAR